MILQENNPMSIKMWKSVPVDSLNLQVYFFNHSDDGIKEVGPFAFTHNLSKESIVFNDKDHVSYRVRKTMFLNEKQTSAKLLSSWTEKSIWSPDLNTDFDWKSPDLNTNFTWKSPEDIWCSVFNETLSKTISINTGFTNQSAFTEIETIGATDGYQFSDVFTKSSLRYWSSEIFQVVSLNFDQIKKEQGLTVFKYISRHGAHNYSCNLDNKIRSLVSQQILVEPFTGKTIHSDREFHITLENNESMSIMKYQESMKPSKKTIKQLQYIVNYHLKVMQSIGGYLLTLSTVILLIIILFLKRVKPRTGTMEFMMNPLNVEDRMSKIECQ